METSPLLRPSSSKPRLEPDSSFDSDPTAVFQLFGRVDEASFKIPFCDQRHDGLHPSVPVAEWPENDESTQIDNHVQFAEYRPDKLVVPLLGVPPSPGIGSRKSWTPVPLRPVFWVPLILFLVVAAIGLEVALHFSKKNQGWPSANTDNGLIPLHYLYTLPPVSIAAVIVSMWAWTDVEIKKIQPYVDLVHGDSPPHRSLLLDYTRDNNFLVWTRAASNRHYLVALASLMVIHTLSFQPLSSALLVVQDTYFPTNVTKKNLAVIGLNQDQQFFDLTSFLTGAGYAGASVLYDLLPPPFIQIPYTVANFELPLAVTTNGTAFANTAAIKSETGCQSVPVQVTKTPAGWTNTASLGGCFLTWDVVDNVDDTTDHRFGTNAFTCDPSTPPQFSPVIFWFFSYALAQASATVCYPTISLWEVNVGVNIPTGNVTHISEIQQFSQCSNFSSFCANVTGPPLNGRAYNGIQFNWTTDSVSQNAIQLQLPATIYRAAVQGPQDLNGSFENNTFSNFSDQVYGIYLALIAQKVYFLPDPDEDHDIAVQVKFFQKRVWLSDVAVHLLATAMLILAFFGTIVHLFHREDRRYLCLKHQPGTIASAVSIGAKTGVGEVLADRQDDIKEALRDKKFRIDPVTMKIIMEGEDGYGTGVVPSGPFSKRKPVLEIFQMSTRRTDGPWPASPMTPKTPPQTA